MTATDEIHKELRREHITIIDKTTIWYRMMLALELKSLNELWIFIISIIGLILLFIVKGMI